MSDCGRIGVATTSEDADGAWLGSGVARPGDAADLVTTALLRDGLSVIWPAGTPGASPEYLRSLERLRETQSMLGGTQISLFEDMEYDCG